MAALSPAEYFLVNDSAILRLQDIISLNSEGNYTKVTDRHGRGHLIRRQLYKLQERLPSAQFFRVSRYQVVNLAHVEKVEPFDRKRLAFRLDDGQEITLSRIQTRQFRSVYAL
jgi:two-component system LytT family response regulator